MKTFYRPEMSVGLLDSFSPSAGKPKKFIEYLHRNGIKVDIKDDFDPLTLEEITLAHDEGYVNDVMNLKVSNGFGDKSWEVAESLPFTTGSFYAAAEWAITHQENTFSPTSGFHHARYFRGGEFCTFNGLMIAALKLKTFSKVSNVVIVDCDQHYGNGTDDIIIRKNATWVKHYSFGKLDVTSEKGNQWLEDFEKELQSYASCDIIFYHAGADPHVNDPLGGSLTSEQLKRRDEIVFKTFSDLKIPVAWNLAGGYQKPIEKVLEIHKVTYIASN